MAGKRSIYEWERDLRAEWPNHRVYNWQEVDAMRVQLAKTGLALGNAQPTLNGILRSLDKLRNEHREAKNYALSDALRDIMEKAGVLVRDD